MSQPHYAHPDILDQHDPMKRAFLAAVGLHLAVAAGFAIYSWMNANRPMFGDPNAGGAAIGIEAVNSIPIPHSGPKNPLANETKSEVPQQPAKPVEREKEEKVSPDAVAIKSRKIKKKLSDVASEKQRFRPFKEVDPNQVFAKQAPQVSSELFSAMPGSGRIGTGANTTLGNRFGAYAHQIQELVAQKWRTNDVDQRFQTSPTAIVTFDLLRNGSVKNIRVIQSSGIPTLDFSAQRAIQDAVLPPIPPGFDRDSAKIEFWFELKR